MNLEELIKEKYGSIDKMLESTGTILSRSYLYQICSNEKNNITLEVALELKRLLELNTIDELMEIINGNKKV